MIYFYILQYIPQSIQLKLLELLHAEDLFESFQVDLEPLFEQYRCTTIDRTK